MDNAKVESKHVNMDLYRTLFVFFLVVIMPQVLNIERGDKGAIIVKAGLITLFFSASLIRTFIKNVKIDLSELLVFIIFFLIQIFVNFFESSYSTLNIGILTNITISASYYLFIASLWGKEKLSKKNIASFALMYQLFIIYACIINIYINASNLPYIFSDFGGYNYNFSSFFSNRNTFGLFLLIGLVLTTYRLRIIGKNKMDLIFMAIILLNLILTLSRTAILGAVVFSILLITLNNKQLIKRAFKFLLIISVSLTVVYILGLEKFFLYSILRLDSGSTHRIAIWAELSGILSHNNILTGLGYGLNEYFTIHNTYLSILAYGGMILLLFYVYVFINSLKDIIFILKKDKYIGNFFLAVFCMYLVISLTETNIPYFTSAQNLIYTIVVFAMPRYYKNYLKFIYKECEG